MGSQRLYFSAYNHEIRTGTGKTFRHCKSDTTTRTRNEAYFTIQLKLLVSYLLADVWFMISTPISGFLYSTGNSDFVNSVNFSVPMTFNFPSFCS